MIRKIKELYLTNFRRQHEWFRDFGISNINNPKKFIRSALWACVPKYKAFPPFIVVDPITNCNLNCPLCSIPPKILPAYGSILSLSDFKKQIENIEHVTNKILFCHAGEPFLNKQLFNMINIVNKKGLISMVGTNGTILDKTIRKKIFSSGLDSLQISFDGFSKQSYEKYRVGADFNKVLSNITALAREKKKLRKRKPIINVTYLINTYNSHEYENAKKYFTSLGLRFNGLGINLNLHRRIDDKSSSDLEHWIDIKHPSSMYKRNKDGNLEFKKPIRKQCDTCFKPVITCNGKILLCCHDIFNSIELGNINEIDFMKFWFSNKYSKIREMASQRMLPICKKCGK